MSRQARQEEAEDARQEMVEAALAADHERAVRDSFAGGALSAIIANEGFRHHRSDRVVQVDAAYEYADLMMLRRKGAA